MTMSEFLYRSPEIAVCAQAHYKSGQNSPERQCGDVGGRLLIAMHLQLPRFLVLFQQYDN